MLAYAHAPAWANPKVKCQNTLDEKDTPYVKLGCFGILRTHSSLGVLEKTHSAVAAARAAYENKVSPSAAWTSVAALFRELPLMPAELESHARDPTVDNHANLAFVLRKASEIASACEIAAMYHDPGTHAKKADMIQMATMANEISTEHLVCPHRICSRLAQLEFETNMAAASAVEVTAKDSASSAGMAPKYQEHAALAQLHYKNIRPDMLTVEQKKQHAELVDRLARSYAETYAEIFKATEEVFSTITVN